MRHSRLLFVVVVAARALLACLDTPQSKTVVDADAQSVRFTGEAPRRFGPNEPALYVVVQVKNEQGQWLQLASTPVTEQATFDVKVTVPEQYWLDPCKTATFRLRTDPYDIGVKALDAQCLSALGPNPTDAEKNGCKTELIEVQRENTHHGNVSIVGQTDADHYRCVNTLDGNLSISGGVSPVISLSRLRKVTGNLSVTLDRSEVVSPQGNTIVMSTLSAPLLKAVNGSLALTMTNSYGSTGSSKTWKFGLDALTHVGGDIALDNQAGVGGHVQGVASLALAKKSVTIHWTATDYWEDGFIPKLARVDGDLSLHADNLPIFQTMFKVLTEVKGNLSIDGKGDFRNYHPLPELTKVGKDLVLDGFEQYCDARPFPKLTSVGERLRISHGTTRGFFGPEHPPQALSLGGLLIAHDGATRLPFTSKVLVAAGGAVRITDNAALCQCHVDHFVDQLHHDGWSGTPITSGNENDASCAGCPAPTCQ
jgi:hypothetical protein